VRLAGREQTQPLALFSLHESVTVHKLALHSRRLHTSCLHLGASAQCPVAQVSKPAVPQACILRRPRPAEITARSRPLPVANRRYGRPEVCATQPCEMRPFSSRSAPTHHQFRKASPPVFHICNRVQMETAGGPVARPRCCPPILACGVLVCAQAKEHSGVGADRAGELDARTVAGSCLDGCPYGVR